MVFFMYCHGSNRSESYGENCLLIVLFIAKKKFAFNFNYFSGILPVDVLFCLLEFVPKIF